MRIKVEHNCVSYYPERCPLSGAGDQVFDCEHDKLDHAIRCAYESTRFLHVDPPINCPMRRGPVAMIVEGVPL